LPIRTLFPKKNKKKKKKKKKKSDSAAVVADGVFSQHQPIYNKKY